MLHATTMLTLAVTECLRNHEDLAKRPDYYLPSVFRERMKAQAS